MPDATIVMGDFNSEPESEEFQRMVGTFHPLYGHVDHLDGFVDSWTVAGERSGDDDCITWWPDPPGRSPGHGLSWIIALSVLIWGTRSSVHGSTVLWKARIIGLTGLNWICRSFEVSVQCFHIFEHRRLVYRATGSSKI